VAMWKRKRKAERHRAEDDASSNVSSAEGLAGKSGYFGRGARRKQRARSRLGPPLELVATLIVRGEAMS
jgi:hypothetical protein